MTARISITTGYYTDILMKRITLVTPTRPVAERVYVGGKLHPFNIDARRCTNHRAEFTGGLEITAHAAKMPYTFRAPRYTTHLKPGWGRDEVLRAIARCQQWHGQNRVIWGLRSIVFQYSDGAMSDQTLYTPDEVEAQERAIGWCCLDCRKFRAVQYCSCFLNMPHEICLKWLEWLAAHATNDLTRQQILKFKESHALD